MKTSRSRTRNLRNAGLAAVAAAMTATAAPPPRVVLIHGIWDTSWTMRRLDAALRAAGCETLVVRLKPNNGSAPLDELGAQVHRDIEARFGSGATFSLVGLSMGGLVARSYLRQFGDPSKIPAVVTIGSPHHGTWLANLLPLPGVKDMRAGSPFLQRLEDDHLRFSQTRWTTIHAPFDLMILPASSSELPWADNITIPVVAHHFLAWDSRVVRQTLAALGLSTTSEPAARVSRHAGSLPRRIPGIPPHPTVSREAQ